MCNNANLCRDRGDVKLIQKVICLYDLVFICVCGYAFLSVNLGELVGVVKGPRRINNQKHPHLSKNRVCFVKPEDATPTPLFRTCSVPLFILFTKMFNLAFSSRLSVVHIYISMFSQAEQH